MLSYKLEKNTYFLRIDKDEEILTTLLQFCKNHSIRCGYFNGIGAINKLEIGIWNNKTKKYHNLLLQESLEITSLIGNITTKDKEIWLHAHINASNKKGQVVGGHLLKANVSVTCEIFITKFSSKLKRKFNKQIGINLIS